MPKYIALFGVQGSGKGTQAEFMSKEYGLPVISMGRLLREEVKKGTKTGEVIDAYMKKGELVPVEITTKIIKRRLARKDAKKGAIFDGFPRSLEQAEVLDELVDLTLVVVLNITDEEAVKRLKNRRQCEKEGHIYHLIFKPPKKRGVCDIDGSKLYQRKDDTPKVIRERIETFHEETEPLFKRYKKQGVLCPVDGMGTPDEVFSRLKTCV